MKSRRRKRATVIAHLSKKFSDGKVPIEYVKDLQDRAMAKGSKNVRLDI